MLEIRNLDAGYGKKQVLFGVSVQVSQGEIVALIGPNGAGKSTLLKAAYGLLPVRAGQICYHGAAIKPLPAANIIRGITFVPQSDRVFTNLTVVENLELGGFQLPRKELRGRITQITELFPVLKDRLQDLASHLSGGHQQLLALARALVVNPRLLMLDEPSLGLSPRLVDLVFEKISELNKQAGVSLLIVEQKVKDVLKISHRVYSMKLGKVVFEGVPETLKDEGILKNLFL